MPTPKEAIAEALQTFDHKNSALWTDDGSPLVSEVQRLTNDKTITRAQINEALPGFARKTDDSVSEEVQPDDEAEIAASTETIIQPAPEAQVDSDDLLGLSSEQEHDRLRALAYKRVQEAEQAIADAKQKAAEAQRAIITAEQRHTRALQLFSAKYPPLTAAENIKQHLRRQAEVQRERIEGARFVPNAAQNPVDATMMDRKRSNGRNGIKQAATFLPRSLAAV